MDLSATIALEELRGVVARSGTETATRWLYDYIRSCPRYESFIQRVDECAENRGTSVPPHGNVLVGIVPAALYREYPESGADGRRFVAAAKAMGLPVQTVAVSPTGTLKNNAEIILEWLRDSPYKQIVIVSLSKGSADMKVALSLPSAIDVMNKIVGWVSVGGFLEGIPHVPWLMSNAKFPLFLRLATRLQGIHLSFLEELYRTPSGALDGPLCVPPGCTLIHVLGFATPGTMTNWLMRALYRQAARHGPNDGFMLLQDALRWPGVIYPVWGADHYFRIKKDLSALIRALLTAATT